MLPLKPPSIGERFGRLIATNSMGLVSGHRAWLFTCDCGGALTTRVSTVRSGAARSCGCAPRNKIVGLSNTEKNQISEGQIFGRLTVLRFLSRNAAGKQIWETVCACGKTIAVFSCNLKNGNSKSCGCLSADNASERARKHGARTVRDGKNTDPPSEYSTWSGMIQRCRNPKNPDYPNYGGRGISVCERWLSFENFLADVGAKPGPAQTIDRVDNERGYEPGNVRWTDWKSQQRNRRNNRIVEYRGEMMPLAKACELAGVNQKTAQTRLRAGRRWDGGNLLSST